MKSEIKINNSKLKIVPMECDSSGLIVLRNKKLLRYQHLVLTGDSGESWAVRSTVGLTKLTIDKYTRDKYPYAWTLEVGKGENYTGYSYTQDDLKVIISFLGSSVLYYQDVAELLAHATEDGKIIKGFYQSYGKEGLKNYMDTLKETVKNYEKYKPSTDKVKHYPVSYSRNRYSVQKLIADLIEDKAMIVTDKFLIGVYEKISGGRKDYEKAGVIPVNDDWCPITGYQGNKTRANLSICYLGKVKVPIPENKYGIEPGIKNLDTIKSLCLIKDGILHQSRLGVRVSSKLAGKLKRMGLVKGELLYPGDLVIDITTIPVISKAWIREINSVTLSRLEVRAELAKIAIEYLDFISPSTDKEITKTDKEAFLESLGIYGDLYRGEIKHTLTGNFYQAVELVSKFSGIPKTKKARDLEYKLFKDTGKCGNRVLNEFLSSLVKAGESVTDLKKVWRENLNNLTVQLRDKKFQIIMSKKSRFEDKGYPYIDDVSKTVEIVPGAPIQVEWKFVTKRVYV